MFDFFTAGEREGRSATKEGDEEHIPTAASSNFSFYDRRENIGSSM